MRALVALIFFALPGLAAAQAQFDVIEGRGDLLGWEAVGRLDAPDAFCTGALISSDTVLTAAHCVFTPEGRPRPPESLTFRAGYYRGTQVVAQPVRRWVAPPTYVAGRKPTHQSVSVDVALLKLAAPVTSSEADPFRILQHAPEGSAVTVLSYGKGREEVLSREPSCAITAHYADAVMGFDCDVTFGSSGAPVFLREDGRLRILSVISSIGGGMAYGPGLAALVPQLAARLRNADARPAAGAGARRITVGGGREGTGARFVRP